MQENALNAGGGSARTSKIRLTGDFCAALGFRIPTVTVLVPAGRLMVLCSSVEETRTVATSTPEVSNCEPETKSEPRTSSKKLLPGAACVMEPETNMGSGLRTLTLSVAEAAGVDSVVTLIFTECPAQIVAAGEYRPEADIGPVVVLPSIKPLTDQTTTESVEPLSRALYCASPPSLTSVGPTIETWLWA